MRPPSHTEDEVFDADDIYDPPVRPPSAAPRDKPGLIVSTSAISSSIDADQYYDKALPVETSPDSKYEWHMEFSSTMLFIIGSILYLVCAVKDYQWSQKLLGLPEWLRMADDDAAWMKYRLEEQYGKGSSYSFQGVSERSGGIRRMLMRSQLRREHEEIAYYSKHYRYTQHDAHGQQHQRNLQIQTPEELYYDLDWASLPPDIQDAYTVLGYTETAWDNGQEVESDSLNWDELTPEMQEAALFIGYTEWIWCECEEPIAVNTGSPTKRPTNEPSRGPVASPTISPTSGPTVSLSPSISPTIAPTATSSESPSLEPTTTSRPTLTGFLVAPDGSTYPRPSVSPITAPTMAPSSSPTIPPSSSPSILSSFNPSSSPSFISSLAPSPSPTHLVITSDSIMETPDELYEDEWWRDLPPEIQDAYKVLGWEEAVWDEGDESLFPPSENMTWIELSPDMQEAAGVIGYTQQSWDLDLILSSNTTISSNSTGNNATMDSNYYEDYDWNELPVDVMEAAVTLGWDQSLWDNSGTAWSDSKIWSELPPEAQEAAAVFGYDEASWNADGDPELEALLREAGGEYISNDDDYLFSVASTDIWVSEYQILYFFAALCFVFTGMLDLATEKAPLHLLMTLAGAFGVASAVFVEEDVRLSNVLDAVSVHLFLFEGIGLLLKDWERELSEDGKWTKRLIIFANSQFLLGAILDVMLSYFYLFDETADWDTALMITWVFSGVLWLNCSLIYMGVFLYDTVQD